MIFPFILAAKFISCLSRLFNLGSGSTWPGEICLIFFPNILHNFLMQIKDGVIIVTGTNGKTTTAKIISQILTADNPNLKIIHNQSGANLINGLISACIQKTSWKGKVEANYAIFEVDEAALTEVISQLKDYKKEIILVLLNLFRDQLDRYGEVDIIANKWKMCLKNLPDQARIILNADDPQIAYLGYCYPKKVIYFGLDKPNEYLKKREYAVDSIFCRRCNHELKYKGVYFSHLGVWYCSFCGNKRPKIQKIDIKGPLSGLYNDYNYLASYYTAEALGVESKKILNSIKNFTPAFGRQEEFYIGRKKMKIFLAKNPAGFNAALKTVIRYRPQILMFVLNDRIPDGRDVSWIWDVDFEMIPQKTKIIVSGDRAYDMGLRIKYSRKVRDFSLLSEDTKSNLKIYLNLKQAIDSALEEISESETLYILPTYSAMLEIRKLLSGRKIL